MTPDDRCAAPTSAHDGMHPQAYVLLRAGSYVSSVVLCDGCAERGREAGLDLQVERRKPPYERAAWPRLRRAA